MSKSNEKVCDICSQTIPGGDEACASNTDLEDVEDRKPVICNECSYDFISRSLTIKTEEFCIKDEVEEDAKQFKLMKLNADIEKTIEVPRDSDFLYCFNSAYSTVNKNTLIARVKSEKDECINKTQHRDSRNSKKRFKCNVCDYSCVKSGQLKQHMYRHVDDEPYKCKICDSLVRPGYLKRHLRAHSGGTSYKCNVCDYSTAQFCKLKRHMCTHTGEKPYKCSVCDHSAVQLSNLKLHMYTHTGEKPHKCKVCNYSSTTSTKLKVHMLKHTGGKPFKCEICNYSCAFSYVLKKHIRIHK